MAAFHGALRRVGVDVKAAGWKNVRTYLVAITALCGPTSGTRRLSAKPASRVQPIQSAPVKSKPPLVSISMFRLMRSPGR
jgi:hypothetical protein